jgi:flagellin
MALVINSNLRALRGNNLLRKNNNRIAQTLQHISSGVRVNTARDDAGRLGSIIRGEADSNGLKMSLKNLNDGTSMIQTLEGGLARMEQVLQRLRELAVQASNDTYNQSDRNAIQAETGTLIKQIDAIVNQTNFNNIKLLDGSHDGIGFFIDDGVDQVSFDLVLEDVNNNSIGRKAQYESQRRGVYLGDLSTGDVTINGVDIRGTTEVDDQVSFSYSSGSAIAKANAINAVSEITGVTARASETKVIGNRTISSFTIESGQHFAINGEKFEGFSVEDYDANGTLRNSINSKFEETGVIASLDNQGQLQLVAADGRNIQIHYAHKNILVAIGLADTSGDETNFAGEVILGAPDRDLKGLIQNVTTTGEFTAGLIEAGGRFDGSEVSKDNYVDFVAHVVKAGNLGVAEIVWERDPGGDVGAAEDFDFIQGVVNPNTDITQVTGDYSTLNGVNAITVGGTYNEGLDRDYIIEVIQAGSTDGPNKAHVQVSTTQDGILINDLELDADAGPQNIATATTGEFITIDVDPSVRTENFTETINPNQSYTHTLGNGVTINGSYNGDLSKEFDVTVVNEGYTQGINQAEVNITEKDTFTGVTTSLGTFTVSGGTINIADGLSITFDAENTVFGVLTEGDTNPADSYAEAVTVSSAEADFVGERGDGTYAIEITTAGPTDLAHTEYRVLFNGAQIVGPRNLTSGDVDLADGLTFNFEASQRDISATSVLTSNGDYANYATVEIDGNYDGLLNDIDLRVRVKEAGRVLQVGETETDDGAILEYSTNGGANYQGDILAIAGQDLALSNGLIINFANSSSQSELVDDLGNSLGVSHTFNSQTVLDDYKGQITIDFDHTDLELSEDATIDINTNGAKIGTGVAGSGDINIVITSGGVSTTHTLSDVQSNDTLNVINGLDITFTNDASEVSLTNIDLNGADDGAAISTTNNYNGALGNTVLTAVHTGDTSTDIDLVGAGNGVGASIDDNYNGSQGDQNYQIVFDGTTKTVPSLSDNGANGVDDNASITLSDTYSGDDQDKSIKVTYDAPTAQASVDQAGSGTFNVAIDPTSEYSRSNGDLNLKVEFEATTTSNQVSHIDTTGATISGAAFTINGNYDWDSGDADLSFKFGGDADTVDILIGGNVVSTQAIADGDVIDLGAIDASFAGVTATYAMAPTAFNITPDGVGTTINDPLTGGAGVNAEYGTSPPYSLDLDSDGLVYDGTIPGNVFISGVYDGTSFGATNQFLITFENGQIGLLTDVVDDNNDDVYDIGTLVATQAFTGDGDYIFSGGSLGTSTITVTLNNTAGNVDDDGFHSAFTFTIENDVVQDQYDFEFRQTQTAKVTNVDTNVFATDVSYATGEIDLGDAQFNAVVGAGDPNVILDITDANDKDSTDFLVELRANQTVTISNADGSNAVSGVNYSGGPVNLNDVAVGGGKPFTSDPDITLNFTNPLNGVDDSYTFDLNTATTVTVLDTDNGNAVLRSGIDVSNNSLALNNANIGVNTGVTVSFTSTNNGIDDTFDVALSKDKTVELFLNNISQGLANASTGTIDLQTALGTDVGFDLTVNTPVNGVDDKYTFTMIRDHGIANTGGNVDLLEIDQKVMETGDQFQADVLAGTLEAGTRYELDVKAPTLEVGTHYNITEQVGTFRDNDIFVASVTHGFSEGPEVMQANMTLSNGVTLELADQNYQIGDEIRFQALQYQGDIVASGEYTDPVYPTTFVVEVTNTGAVDGGAQFEYTRLDNGDTAGGLSATSNPTLLQDNVNITFSAGTLYAGDKFVIETVSALSQNFSSRLILESNEGIEVELTSATIDNQLGRLLYVGDPTTVDEEGSNDSLTEAYLGMNTEQTIAQVNLSTKEEAQDSLRILDESLEQISEYRTNVGAIQNRLERQVGNISEQLFQTENYVSRIKDADIANETAEFARTQIIQQLGAEMLAQINLTPSIILQLLS